MLRRIIAKHLGLSETAQANGEPFDNADFYLIGGDSITVGGVIVSCLKTSVCGDSNKHTFRIFHVYQLRFSARVLRFEFLTLFIFHE